MTKKLLLALCFILSVSFMGCSKDNLPSSEPVTYPEDLQSLPQLAPPKEGDQIAVITTNMGVIKVKLLPEAAPKAVENFKTHAENKYYDGLIFHRVINNFMIQGGDPTGTGAGGESIWGKPFEDEFDAEVHNFRGALSMANGGPNTNGSQFFIVQSSKLPAGMLDKMKEIGDDSYSPKVLDAYSKLGGTPWLDYKHTVFGQVIEGMNIVDSIAAVETGEGDKPKEDVVIKSIRVEEYKK